MIKVKGYYLIAMFFLVLSPMAQAGIVGTWTSKGVLNVTFKKPNHLPVKTVSNIDQSWVFNADQTFTQGGLTGIWRKTGTYKLFEASYDLSNYASYLTDFWAARGVIVSNIHILKNQLEIQKVSNGLSGEGILKYVMDVTENNGIQTTKVIIRSSFVALNNSNENAALTEFFPTLLPEQANSAAGSITTRVIAPLIPFIIQGP